MDQATARALDRDTQGQPVTKTSPAPSAKKDRSDNPIYASRALDEYGLTPNELRVYFRIARRAGEEGKCWESVPNMASAIGLGERTVRRCCQILRLARLINEQEIEGWSTDRWINPISKWKNKAELPGIRNIVLRSEKKHEKKRTPATTDRGVTRDTPAMTDGAPLPCETGEPLSPQTVLPLSPETDEGIPSEGSPFEGNPEKVIPHTHSATDFENANTREAVCVAIPIPDLDQLRKEYARMNSYPHSKKIRNPEGWLYTARDGRYDDLLVLPWWREREEQERERMTIAERLQEEAAAEAERTRAQAAKAEAEWEEFRKQKAEEWERNAPQREREATEKAKQDRRARFEQCQKLAGHIPGARTPEIYERAIRDLLGDDEQLKAEFEEWRAGQNRTETATAT